jgi:hypothetical protein
MDKMYRSFGATVIITVCIPVLFLAGNAIAVELFISPEGSDANQGTISAPFATLTHARDMACKLSDKEPIEIILREGTYYLPEPLLLAPQHSGTEKAPVTWRAADGERVVLSGGVPITGTWAASEQDGVWHVDLPSNLKNWNFRQLFVDGKRATRARFPNVSEANPFLYATGGDMDHVMVEPSLVRSSWSEAADAQINIVAYRKFYNQRNTVTSVNKATGRIDFSDSERDGKIVAGNWFWIEGVREELDQPGEWYLDRSEGRLYYMPEPGIDPNTLNIVAPWHNVLVYAKGDVEQGTHVEYVHFKNLEFWHTTYTLGHIEARVHTDAAIRFDNASHCRAEGCHFENIGGYAFWLHLDCQRNVFDNNTVLNSGAGGVLLTGARLSYMDDSKVFTPGEAAARVFPILNHITRNTVKHCGKIRYYGGGVHLDSRPACMAMAPGNYIAHNHFQDLSRNGIFAFRNQGGNVVEYNHIHDTMQTTIDGACIHFATMNHLNAPNYILNNWLYDIWGYEQLPSGKPKRHLANGVFLDWATSNTTVKNNYIYNPAGEAIKPIMGNWNIDIADNKTSKTRIVPPFVDEVGPEGTATNGIDLESNFLIGGVIHYSDEKQVVLSGDWKPRTIEGFWGLFSFNLLEAEKEKPADITYTLPINEDGMYQISLLYLPDEKNASNAKIQVTHADGTDNRVWNMKQGDKFGFALEVGKYRCLKAGITKVTISNESADGVVVADSVAFVKID